MLIRILCFIYRILYLKIKAEVLGALDFMRFVYTKFGMSYKLELSTRPAKVYLDLKASFAHSQLRRLANKLCGILLRANSLRLSMNFLEKTPGKLIQAMVLFMDLKLILKCLMLWSVFTNVLQFRSLSHVETVTSNSYSARFSTSNSI